MERKEYEYSIKVNSFDAVYDYCQKKGFHCEGEFGQERTIYRNPNNTMARITVNIANGQVSKELDFKEHNLAVGSIVKEVRETLSITFVDDEAIESILEFLQYKKDNTIKRTRHIYEKGNVKFELDDYTSPECQKVVAIEGEKTEVDRVYNEIKNRLDVKKK